MLPFTVIQTPHSGTLRLNLPRELDGKRLRVTITEEQEFPHQEHLQPEESPSSANPNARLLEILRSTPSLSDEDLAGFAEVRAHINQWRSE